MNADLSFLDSSAAGLDFSDPEDRTIFRLRVAERLKCIKLEAMREWTGWNYQTRIGGTNGVAALYMKQNRK